MKQVLLIRHCETSLQGRYIGRTDPSLTASGIVRARGLAGRLQRLVRAPTSRQIPVLSSPARRAVETARLATEWTGSGIWRDEDLREIDFGAWEGKDFREIVATDAELVDKWARDEMGFCFPGGECVDAFRERVKRAGRRLRGRREEMVVVVTHGGVIRFLICHFLGLPPQLHFRFEVAPGSITGFRLYDGGAVLTGLNDFDV